MNHDQYEDGYIRTILEETKTVAVIGASPKPERDSHRVTQFLIDRGYEVYPVNPGHAGKTICGKHCYNSIKEIPQPIHMIDVFRNVSVIPAIVDEVLELSPLPLVIWTQLGIRDDVSAKRAEESGLKVVMNRCPKIEVARLGMFQD